MFQKKLEKALPQIDHIDPQTQYDRFKNKYTKKDNKTLINYLEMISEQQKDYFPQQDFDQQTLQILSKQQIFSARLIFLLKYFQPKNKLELKNFTSNSSTFQQFIKLGNQRQYQERFLADIGYLSKKQTNLTVRSEFKIENYKFYSGKGIENLHQKQGDYDFLQDKHDYIQWMFPNHFQSMFNSHSSPMSYIQVKFFRKSRYLGQKLLKSIKIFFDFMGIQLNFKDFNIQIISQKRLKQALLINCHNHLRLRRILACLSITGFRLIALRLIQFLGQLIQNDKRYSRLAYTFKRQWEVYGDKQKQKALQLCFHPEDNFPQDHKVLLSLINPKNISQLKIQGLNNQQEKKQEERKQTKFVQSFDSQDEKNDQDKIQAPKNVVINIQQNIEQSIGALKQTEHKKDQDLKVQDNAEQIGKISSEMVQQKIEAAEIQCKIQGKIQSQISQKSICDTN